MTDVAVVVTEAELLPVCGAPGCSVVARPEQALCDDHAVQQRVLAARRKLAENAPMAAEQLIDLCENADNADVRRRAAEAILDRVGIRPGVEVEVSAGIGRVDPAELLRTRLATLRDNTALDLNPVAEIEAGHEGSNIAQAQSGEAATTTGT
ncbi:MAG TPA: hypothetical protein VHA79_09295 [Mycobacteriales bacterium]|nr:hypothetical protein [Mycobacteriales bacterium]